MCFWLYPLLQIQTVLMSIKIYYTGALGQVVNYALFSFHTKLFIMYGIERMLIKSKIMIWHLIMVFKDSRAVNADERR